MSLSDRFPHRCTIRRKSYTKDSLGAAKLSYVTEQTDVECWEQATGDNEDRSFQKRGMSLTRKIYFKTNPEVTARHEILVTYRNGSTIADPIPFRVVSTAMPDATAGLGVFYRVMCEEYTSEDD